MNIFSILPLLFATNRLAAQQSAATQPAPASNLVSSFSPIQAIGTEKQFQSNWNSIIQSLAGLRRIDPKNKTVESTLASLERTKIVLLKVHEAADRILQDGAEDFNDVSLAAKYKIMVLQLEDELFNTPEYRSIKSHATAGSHDLPKDQEILESFLRGLSLIDAANPGSLAALNAGSKFTRTEGLNAEAMEEGENFSPTRPAPQTPIPHRESKASDVEKALISAAKNGDSEAFKTLYNENHKRVYAIAYRMLGNHHTAEDLTQDIFMKFHEKLGVYRPDQPLIAFLSTMIRNKAINHLRDERLARQSISLDETQEGPDGESRAPLEIPYTDKAQRSVGDRFTLEKIMAAIPSDRRVLLHLSHVEGYEYPEIARMVKLTEPVVKSRLHQARRRLRKVLLQKRPEHKLEIEPEVNPSERNETKSEEVKNSELTPPTPVPPVQTLNQEETELIRAIAKKYLSDADDTSILAKSVEEMPADRRKVFLLHYGSGLSHKEISGKLGILKASSIKNLNRARRQLSEVIREKLKFKPPVKIKKSRNTPEEQPLLELEAIANAGESEGTSETFHLDFPVNDVEKPSNNGNGPNPWTEQNQWFANNIGAWIKQLREGRGFTQSELTSRSKVTRSYISRIEKGQMVPSIETLERFSEGFEIGLETIFSPDFYRRFENFALIINQDPLMQEAYALAKALNQTQRNLFLNHLHEILSNSHQRGK